MYIEGKDKLYSEESKQTIAELQAKFQVEKKDKDNERLKHSEQLNKAQIKNQQVNYWLCFVYFAWDHLL